MRKNLMFVALAAIGFASCNGGFKQGENGMLYNIYKDNGGAKIKEGDFLTAQMILKNDGDSVIVNSWETGQPQPLILQKSVFKGDIFDGLKLLGEGDSATIKVAADSVFKTAASRPPSFKGSKYIIYDIKIEKVIPKGKLTDAEFQQAYSTYLNNQALEVKKQEPARIAKYIADNKLTLAKTDSGLNYVITKKGNGPTPAANDTVVVNYTGKLLTGKVFDSNIKEDAIKGKLPDAAMRPYAPIRFPIGQQRVIKGWDEGLMLLNKGAKATFIVPSSLGYGEQGNQVIPPNSPLVFEVEMVDIVHPNPNAVKPPAHPSFALPPSAKR